ncbi:hypothetical protein [Okeania sp. SIO2B3]|uniref:hypothetical protein n=1 Tax=Okeania sp. SIO2B3 TaxID=2607784 RepID=UPI0025D66A94|nr:hypothetical protein [Okeania sp. SIO2B3]
MEVLWVRFFAPVCSKFLHFQLRTREMGRWGDGEMGRWGDREIRIFAQLFVVHIT